jgi:hypothetical protein
MGVIWPVACKFTSNKLCWWRWCWDCPLDGCFDSTLYKENKNYKLSIYCFSTKHTALQNRNKDWSNISTYILLFQWASNMKFMSFCLKWWVMSYIVNATFNNLSVISWQSVLLVEEPRVPGENHQSASSHWQTLSHNVVWSTSRLSARRNEQSL